MGEDYKRFDGLTYDAFRELAANEGLNRFEKIGFPSDYREGREERIFEDIRSKLAPLRDQGKRILDIGPGCSGLPFMLIDLCERNGHNLILADSEEMLSHLPDRPFIEKCPGKFPACAGIFEKYRDKIDAILVYSVLQHVFLEANIFNFIDTALSLLSEGGELLLGDIPNATKRKRFFSSRKGIETHRRFTGRDELPEIGFMKIDKDRIDDGVVFAILQRYRNAGFETYLLPQGRELPLETRREDILIRRN